MDFMDQKYFLKYVNFCEIIANFLFNYDYY